MKDNKEDKNKLKTIKEKRRKVVSRKENVTTIGAVASGTSWPASFRAGKRSFFFFFPKLYATHRINCNTKTFDHLLSATIIELSCRNVFRQLLGTLKKKSAI